MYLDSVSLIQIVGFSAVFLLVAYFTYGRLLSRLLRIDPKATTPAVELRDDIDYAPLDKNALLSQHFSAIAAAGPIVGPIIAGAMFGWLPALIWILVGSVFVGGVHDFAALIASMRHKARSIAEVVREHMSHRAFLLFLAFIWLALVYIIVAFTDITALSFIGRSTLEDGATVVTGAGIASSSLLYLALPIIMGLLVRYTKLTMGWATLIFLPLVGVAIWVGQLIPFDVEAMVLAWDPSLSPERAASIAHKIWDVALLGYSCIASIVPMWLLLQPRGHLGGYFLYVALGGAALGLVLGGESIQYPAFTAWTAPTGETMFPILFITIACGACSGFHALVATGTTSKQVRTESDARVIGYGAMLLEGMVAVVSLCCVMILAPGSEILNNIKPNFVYALGIGSFLEVLNIPPALGVSFALMAFTTFVYDTLDVCTRLGRYIIQELTGLQGRAGRWMGTGLTAGVPVFFVMQTMVDASGKPIPVWRAFWSLFGASNQLLAALTLLGVSVWLWRTRRAWWIWLVTGIPMVWMYIMSNWALVRFVSKPLAPWLQGEMTFGELLESGAVSDPVAWVASLLLILAALMLWEAVVAIIGARPDTPKPSLPSSPSTAADGR